MMKQTHSNAMNSANSGQAKSSFAQYITAMNLLLAMTVGVNSYAQADKSNIRKEAQDDIKLEKLAPEVKSFFKDAQSEIVFTKSEKKEAFFDDGLKELEKKANRAKNLEALRKAAKEGTIYLGQFSAGGKKTIKNNGSTLKFSKKDLENAYDAISRLQKEAEDMNNLFEKSTAEVTPTKNAVDSSAFKNVKGQVEEIKRNLDQQKKALDALKDDLVNKEKAFGETSANLTSEKVKLENLKRSYSVFGAIPAKTNAEAAESEKIEDNMATAGSKIRDLAAALNDLSNAVDELKSQISQAEDALKEQIKNYEAAIANINAEELAMYKKQQGENKNLLDTSLTNLGAIIKEKNDVVMSLDTTLKEISNAIKNQTQNPEASGPELEGMQKKRADAIKNLTEVNKELQKVGIQAQEYLKNSYAVQLNILNSSENYYNQTKSLVTSDIADLKNQIAKNRNEVTGLENQKKNLKKGLDTLSTEAVAERTNKLLEIQVHITFINSRTQQLETEVAQKNGELDAVNKELADIAQVKDIVRSYDQLVEYIVRLSELLNNLQELKLQNNYTEREISLQESVSADLNKKFANLQAEITQLTANVNDTSLSDQAELEVWKELQNKRQEANLIAAQIKALATSQELSKARMAQELGSLQKLNDQINEKVSQKTGREIRDYVAKTNNNRSNNKYYDGNIIEPKILEEYGIVNMDSLKKLVSE